jgi:zinc/manganese transport system permease protein
MAFPGAAGAALAGLPTSVGYYLATSIAALVIGRSGRRAFGSSENALIGTVQAVGLALGFLFLSLNHAVLGGLETLLFGSILGVSAGQVTGVLIVTVVSLALLTLAARPLLFSTLDPDVARARGVPVAALDAGFLLVLAVAIAATSQITGALLVFALLVAPAAAAQQITMRPLPGLALSVAFALLVAWLGLGVTYFSSYQPGFWITTFGFGLYVLVRLGKAIRA